MHTDNSTFACRICLATGAFSTWDAPEMMFGTRETFLYFRCGACGTLQINDIPDDIGRHYPPAYYQDSEPTPAKQGFIGTLYRMRNEAAASGSRFGLGAILNYLTSDEMLQSVGFSGVKRDSRILDVGCGPGILLKQLRELGFSNLEGLDAYRPADLDEAGLKIRKGHIETVDIPSQGYDLLMFHHSLEHVPEPAVVLRRARQFLSPAGKLLIRIPVSDSFAWRHYGVDWAQLDPPRHYYLMTDQAMAVVAKAAGLTIERKMRDSGAFQFWASRNYRDGIPLRRKNEPSAIAPRGFSRLYLRLASLVLNAFGQGDQAVYVLKPVR
ncbi:class I SAM-dependent methyltransferase [Nevskia ramosa]|uniref:class I SAM-dependent methyltransferase n=1 Tax=Nevskia ramosa TaxID=64002 RepID=UPI0003B43872|nr:class I SAM-dependent methyltransferase [Nevskia ramosa]